MSLYLGTTPIADGASTALLAGKADVDLTNVNASGTSLASGWSMPSSRYIDLTLGASGATYTAPANGWYACRLKLSTTGWLQLNNNSASGLRLAEGVYSTSIWAWAISYVPCKKGDVIGLAYSGTVSESNFKFIYAEGEENV